MSATKRIDAEKPASGHVQSVSRAIAILNAVAMSENGLTASELSTSLGLSKPTTYHLLRTLQHAAFLFRGSDRRYRLDFRIGTLAEGFERQLLFEETLTEYVRQLADATDELSHLCVRRGSSCILIKSVAARHVVQAAPPLVGPLDDLHARASGKVAMAWAPIDVRTEFLRSATLNSRTPATITDRRELERELAKVGEQGYATSIEESDVGLSSLAAPIDEGLSPFILGLTAPRERFEKHFDEYLRALLQATDRASSRTARPGGNVGAS